MRVLCFLMPYSGHFFPHLKLLELFAAKKDVTVKIYCDKKFSQYLPGEMITIENYPEEVRAYCRNIARYQENRESAAREYYSYMADSRVIELKRQQDIQVGARLAGCLEKSVCNFAPDIVLYDPQAVFTSQLRKNISCPQFQLNASTFSPKLWQSCSFRQYYQEILRPSYKGDISYDQVLAFQRKAARREEKRNEISFGYLSPLLQDEYDKIPALCRSIGFRMDCLQSDNRRGIYVTRGTVSESHGAFLLYDTVNGLSRCKEPVHVSCGGNLYVQGLFNGREFPENVFVHTYTDQRRMLSESRVFVTHGGITGVREAIFAHTPMLVIPANFPDYQVGRAIEKNHAGVLIHKRPLQGDEIVAGYEEICRHYGEYAEGVKNMARELEDCWNQSGAEAIWKECERAV